MKTALYIRVSTREQAERGFSIGGQKERLLNYAKAKDFDDTEAYIDDGYSGSSLNRPQITRLMQDVKKGKVSTVIVFKLDRLSRSQKDTLHLIEDVFNKYDVAFISLNESFDTSTPFGRAMVGMLSVFAQLERENIKERVELGKKEKAKKGLWNGGRGDYLGYNYVGGKFTIDPYEAEIVKEIYALSFKGYGNSRIMKAINEKYKGAISSISTVNRTLQNPIYIGKIRYDGEVYQSDHEPIIDESLFNQTQIIKSKRSTRTDYKSNNSPYLLSGLLKCAKCGAGFVGRDASGKYGEYKYYVCYKKAAKYRLPPDEVCDAKAINLFEAHDEIFQLLRNIRSKDMKLEPSEKENSMDSMEKELKKVDIQLERATELYINGTIPMDILNDKLEKLKEKKSGIQKIIDEYSPVREEAIKQFNKVQDIDLEKMDNNEIKNYLAIIINNILVDKGDIEVRFNFAQ